MPPAPPLAGFASRSDGSKKGSKDRREIRQNPYKNPFFLRPSPDESIVWVVYSFPLYIQRSGNGNEAIWGIIIIAPEYTPLDAAGRSPGAPGARRTSPPHFVFPPLPRERGLRAQRRGRGKTPGPIVFPFPSGRKKFPDQRMGGSKGTWNSLYIIMLS